MAPPPAMDLSHSEYRLVAALRESTEKLVEAKVAAAIQESINTAVDAKVAAAIQESINTAVDAKVAAALHAAKDEKNGESKKAEPMLDMAGMHCQILSNAKHLYPLLARRAIYHKLDFDVVTYVDDSGFHAAVVFVDEGYTRVLLKGPKALGEANALQKLLTMTSVQILDQLAAENKKDFDLPGDSECGWHDVQTGNGSFFCVVDQ